MKAKLELVKKEWVAKAGHLAKPLVYLILTTIKARRKEKYFGSPSVFLLKRDIVADSGGKQYLGQCVSGGGWLGFFWLKAGVL